MNIERLRLKILDKPDPEGNTAFDADELQSILDDADGSILLAAANALDILVKDEDKLRRWARHPNGEIDYNQLRKDIMDAGNRFRDSALEVAS